MCEGTTDVISAHQIGVKNIVAPLGTALTKEQLFKISKLTKNILFLFDSDSAGQSALEKAFILSQEHSLSTYATNTLPYKDIDEMIRESPTKFKNLVKKRIDAYTYLLTQFVKDKNLNKFEEYHRTVSWMENILSHVKNRSNLLFYVKSSYSITKIKPFQKALNDDTILGEVKSGNSPSKKASKDTLFLQHLLYQKNLNAWKNFDLKYFEDEKIKEILSFVSQNPDSKREDILKHFEQNSIIKGLIEDSIFSFSKSESNIEDIANIYNGIVREYYQRKEAEYQLKIASAEQTGKLKESEKLFKEFQNLTKEKQKYEQSSGL